MGSASQQLSQLTDSGSLSPSLAYLLLCDAMFWGFGYLVLYLYFLFFFTSGFLPHFLVRFFLPSLCLKGLVCVKLFAKLDCCRTLCPFP
jgi:hypothetical protein